jgi:hypothetical protein
MAGFIQIIEFHTTKIDEMRALGDEWRERTDGGGNLVRGTIVQDRDRPNTYLNIVEFGSYEEAMANSDRPETSAFAARMAELCDAPPTFRNLDVVETWSA